MVYVVVCPPQCRCVIFSPTLIWSICTSRTRDVCCPVVGDGNIFCHPRMYAALAGLVAVFLLWYHPSHQTNYAFLSSPVSSTWPENGMKICGVRIAHLFCYQYALGICDASVAYYDSLIIWRATRHERY